MKDFKPLYGRVPLGVGTPFVESLTSFMGRLAMARHLTLGSVFKHLIGPIMPRNAVREDVRSSRPATIGGITCDGLGKPAEDVTTALTNLTGLENLSLHTMLPWRPLISSTNSRTLRYGQKRWCALCLAQWRARGSEFWEPLLWRMTMVRRCPTHRTPFSDVCPRCESSQGLLQEMIPFGNCRKCGHYLEMGDPWTRTGSEPCLEEEEARREWWMSVEVGRLLAFQGTVSAYANPEGFPLMLKKSASSEGYGSIQDLARFLGVAGCVAKDWMAGHHLPTFESFVLVCMRLGVDPLHVAIFPRREARGECAYPKGEIRPWWPQINRQLPCSFSGRRGPEFWNNVTKGLSRMLSGPEVGRLSVTRAAKTLGINSETLKKRYPDKYARLLQFHAAYCKREKARTFAQRRDKMRAAVDAYVDEGVHPTQERVFRRAGVPINLTMLPEYRQIWLDALFMHGLAPLRKQ